MRTLSKFTAMTFCFVLCGIFPLTSQAQSYCSNLGSLVICDGGRTTIAPLGRNGGVILDDERGVTPYMIMPAPDRDRRPLDDPDRLDFRRQEPRDEFRSPFDLEPRDGVLLLPE